MWFFLVLRHFNGGCGTNYHIENNNALNQRFLHMETREELEERIKAELLDFLFNECNE